tara:strand:- start:698 stop:1459 length:762 start_codon:yes stop_codon:yes gene_type:complete
MLPLFKSDFSIGKSILTLNTPSSEEGVSSDSIFEIATENDLDQVVLVEDNLTGFLEAHKNSKALDIQLIFGLRLSICNDLTSNPKETERKDESKVIIFAKSDNGCKKLNQIYSLAFTEGEGRIDYKSLRGLWSQDLLMAIPFYDSFIFNNALYFSNCIPKFNFFKPTFFLEDNGLPFDSIVRDRVLDYCSDKDFKTEEVKSIYYKNKSDFAAFQTYKCICSRNFSGGEVGLANPRLEHCSSSEFSFESWKNNN